MQVQYNIPELTIIMITNEHSNDGSWQVYIGGGNIGTGIPEKPYGFERIEDALFRARFYVNERILAEMSKSKARYDHIKSLYDLACQGKEEDVWFDKKEFRRNT